MRPYNNAPENARDGIAAHCDSATPCPRFVKDGGHAAFSSLLHATG